MPQDKAQAAAWYGEAALMGNGDSLLPLARIHATGDGVPRDMGKAILWYHRAAAIGSGEAMLELGRIHAEGDGVPQDKWMAAAWYFEACDHGEDRKGRQAVESLGVDVDDIRQNRKVMNVLMELRMGMAKCTLLYAHDGKCMTSQGKARLAEKDIATSEISTWALDSLACLKAKNGNDLPPRIRKLADAVQAEAEELRRRMMAD